MKDSFDANDKAVAAERGWEVCEVYDLRTSRWLRAILPTAANPNKNAAAVQQAVIAAAGQGDGVSIRALRTLVPTPTRKPTRRKK